MIILGLHCGHDASVSVIKNGKVLVCLEKERHTRVKHAMTLDHEIIMKALVEANIALDEVSFCTLTSTQLVEYVFLKPNKFCVVLEPHKSCRFPCSLIDEDLLGPEEFNARGDVSLDYVFRLDKHQYHWCFPNGKKLLQKAQSIGQFEEFITPPVWQEPLTTDDIEKRDFTDLLKNKYLEFGFHYPATTKLCGREIPSYFINHHFAHLAYSYYQSAQKDSLIISMDGGGNGKNYSRGFFAFAIENKIYPICPHHYDLGGAYDTASDRIGFMGNPGKLMGLSAYGEPDFIEESMIGNYYDIRMTPDDICDDFLKKAKFKGLSFSAFGNPEKILNPINTKFASSIQRYVEINGTAAVQLLQKLARRYNVESKNLCLSGGVFLNCPLNSAISKKCEFDNIFVPPAIGDMGLSIGSAQVLYYHIANNQLNSDAYSPEIALLGAVTNCGDNLILKTLSASGLDFERVDNPFLSAARDLMDNNIVGWFVGRSEIGPRALGNRSILANPLYDGNSARVNKIKGREEWRPLAPAVLQEHVDEFFEDGRKDAYFMNITGRVTNDRIPAVTHVDLTARLQIVTIENRNFYSLLNEFYLLSDCPLVLNTSLNGKGEPIVETPQDAINFFISTAIDRLYLGNYKIWR